MTTVGTKYQVVIERHARKQLGVAPGAQAIQRVVGDHLEIRFLPSERPSSHAGSLRRYARSEPDDPAAEKDAAWESHGVERWGRTER